MKPASARLRRCEAPVSARQARAQPVSPRAGLARVEGDSRTKMTQTGVVMGTPAYLSPEQALGRPTDFRTDVFAFGLLMYELASGTNPFIGQSVTATLVLFLTPVFAVAHVWGWILRSTGTLTYTTAAGSGGPHWTASASPIDQIPPPVRPERLLARMTARAASSPTVQSLHG